MTNETETLLHPRNTPQTTRVCELLSDTNMKNCDREWWRNSSIRSHSSLVIYGWSAKYKWWRRHYLLLAVLNLDCPLSLRFTFPSADCVMVLPKYRSSTTPVDETTGTEGTASAWHVFYIWKFNQIKHASSELSQSSVSYLIFTKS